MKTPKFQSVLRLTFLGNKNSKCKIIEILNISKKWVMEWSVLGVFSISESADDM